MLAQFPFIFVEEGQLGYIGNQAGGTEVNHPTYCWKADWGDLSLRDNYNGTDKNGSQIKYRSLYLKGGVLYRKRVITIMFVVLLLFNLVLPGETKLRRLFSFPLFALLHLSLIHI